MKELMIQMYIVTELKEKGLEEGIKEILTVDEKTVKKGEKYYIKESESKEEGIYQNKIAHNTYKLRVISEILSYKPLFTDRKHIKTLTDELRTIADSLEELI